MQKTTVLEIPDSTLKIVHPIRNILKSLYTHTLLINSILLVYFYNSKYNITVSSYIKDEADAEYYNLKNVFGFIFLMITAHLICKLLINYLCLYLIRYKKSKTMFVLLHTTSIYISTLLVTSISILKCEHTLYFNFFTAKIYLSNVLKIIYSATVFLCIVKLIIDRIEKTISTPTHMTGILDCIYAEMMLSIIEIGCKEGIDVYLESKKNIISVNTEMDYTQKKLLYYEFSKNEYFSDLEGGTEILKATPFSKNNSDGNEPSSETPSFISEVNSVVNQSEILQKKQADGTEEKIVFDPQTVNFPSNAFFDEKTQQKIKKILAKKISSRLSFFNDGEKLHIKKMSESFKSQFYTIVSYLRFERKEVIFYTQLLELSLKTLSKRKNEIKNIQERFKTVKMSALVIKVFVCMFCAIAAFLNSHTQSPQIIKFLGSAFGLAYVLQPMFSSCVDGLIFIVFIHPFDKKDRILINLESDEEEVYTVLGANLLYTVLKKWNNTILYVFNREIELSIIPNLSRTKSIAQSFDFFIDLETAEEKIEKIRLGIIDFINLFPEMYENRISFNYVTVDKNRLVIRIILTFRVNGFKDILRCRSLFVEFIWVFLKRIDVDVKSVDRTVKIKERVCN